MCFCVYFIFLQISYYHSSLRFNPLFVQQCKVNLPDDAEATESLQQISPLITPESCSRCHVDAGCWQKPGMPTSPNICPNSASPSWGKSGRPLWSVCEVRRVCNERVRAAGLSFHSYADSRGHLFALSAA